MVFCFFEFVSAVVDSITTTTTRISWFKIHGANKLLNSPKCIWIEIRFVAICKSLVGKTWKWVADFPYDLLQSYRYWWPPKNAVYWREKCHELSRKMHCELARITSITKIVRNTFTQALRTWFGKRSKSHRTLTYWKFHATEYPSMHSTGNVLLRISTGLTSDYTYFHKWKS